MAVVNPYREPGMERYFVPSDLESALFGTRIADRFFQILPGGDIAFLHGAAKWMLEEGWVDPGFIRAHTAGFEAYKALLGPSPSPSWRRRRASPARRCGPSPRWWAGPSGPSLSGAWGSPSTPTGRTTCGPSSTSPSSRASWGGRGAASCPSAATPGSKGAEMGAYATAFPGGFP